MSIETTGPEKYEFQDYVCLRTALRLRNLTNLQCFVEPEGLEDALFRVWVDGGPVEIELQVKGSQADVTLSTVADCLTHFPPRRAEKSLLERLLNSEKRFAVLTMSGRCNDETSLFCRPKPWELTAHPQRFLPIVGTKRLLAAISEQHSKGKSRLAASRHARCEELGKTVLPKTLCASLTRLLIEDLITKETVVSECESILKKDYLIPDDRLPLSVEALLSQIRTTKYEARKIKRQVDAWPLLRSTIVGLTSRSVRPHQYFVRGEEGEWCSELRAKGVLLLSGRPRCGKSYAARAVAADFQEMGYEVRECADLGEAERFLLDTCASNRLCVVDDPLGALQLSPEASRELERLKWLAQRIQPNRKLIVAQSQDQLFEVTNKGGLSDCIVAGIAWRDLSVAPIGFLPNTWIKFAEEFNVRPEIRSTVERFLKHGQIDPEVGCLYHLAANAGLLSHNPSAKEALALAREDASNLGSSLARSNQQMGDILCAIAIGSASGKPLALDDLAFLLDEDDSSLPGNREDLGTVVFGGGRETEEEFPSYGTAHRLASDVRPQIDKLERRGFISILDSRIAFKHAFYEAAARSVLNSPTTLVAKRASRLFERALFCLSSDTSSAAITNAEWIIHTLRDHDAERFQIMKNIELGLECIFPATRDACFEFLIRNLESYSGDHENQLERWVSSSLSGELDDLKWRNGQAWIPSMRRFLNPLAHVLDEGKVESDKSQLETDEANLVPPERAARVAEFVRGNPEKASSLLVERLLGFDEALIRAASAAAWVAIERDNDSDLLDRIFEDRHPKILLEVLDECILRWGRLSPKRQAELARRLVVAVSSKSAALAVLPRMIVFNRVEYSGDNPPWSLFESLMPAVLSALPLHESFAGPRLYSVMQSAARLCRPDAVVAMCRSWVNWIELQVAAGRNEQYELSVTGILVDATRRQPGKRKGIIDRLLSIRPTSALIYIVSDVQDCWEDLTRVERRSLLSLLQESRQDRLWLRAVALTRSAVPLEIQVEILGRADALKSSSKELLAMIPSDLLNAAVAVQCGKPGEFWDIAHRSDTFSDIARKIEGDSSHPMFETTFWEVVHQDDDARMTKIIESASDEHLDRIFRLLLTQRVECTGMFLPNSWAKLLARADSERRRTWLREMSSAAPECIDDLGEIGDWLKRDEDQRELMELLASDYRAELLAIRLERGEIAAQMGLEMLKGLIEHEPPRFFGTYDHIKTRLKKAGIYLTDLLGLIDSARKHCFEERKKIKICMEENTSVQQTGLRFSSARLAERDTTIQNTLRLPRLCSLDTAQSWGYREVLVLYLERPAPRQRAGAWF